MKRAYVGVAMVLVLVGCRALVGIDDLEPDRAPPNGNDGGKDNIGKNDGGGPGPGPGDTGGPAQPDAALALTCKAQGQECRKCCKNSSPILHNTFEGTGPGAQCLCDKANCSVHCQVDGKCVPGQLPNSTPGTPDDCVLCVDMALTSTAGVCTDACGGNPDCLAAVKCMQDCPQP